METGGARMILHTSQESKKQNRRKDRFTGGNGSKGEGGRKRR